MLTGLCYCVYSDCRLFYNSILRKDIKMKQRKKAKARTEMISLRLTPKELEMLRAKARKEGLTLTSLLISHALEGKGKGGEE